MTPPVTPPATPPVPPPERPTERPTRPAEPPHLAEDGPTELVPDAKGELVERLSGGTATLLLVWLVGIGAGTALLGVWIFSAVVIGARLGIGALLGGPGLYTAIAGAAGPCVLWLAGRAQGHSIGWFAWTGLKVGLVMLGFVVVFFFGSALLFGFAPGPGAPFGVAVAAGLTVAGSLIWAVAVWAADRYIAVSRIEGAG